MIDYGTGYENIQRVLEHELEVMEASLSDSNADVFKLRKEQARVQIAMLARVLDDAFAGSKTTHNTPERAADAAHKLVTLLREIPRSS